MLEAKILLETNGIFDADLEIIEGIESAAAPEDKPDIPATPVLKLKLDL